MKNCTHFKNRLPVRTSLKALFILAIFLPSSDCCAIKCVLNPIRKFIAHLSLQLKKLLKIASSLYFFVTVYYSRRHNSDYSAWILQFTDRAGCGCLPSHPFPLHSSEAKATSAKEIWRQVACQARVYGKMSVFRKKRLQVKSRFLLSFKKITI